MPYTLDDFLDDNMDFADEWLDDTLYVSLKIRVRCIKCPNVTVRTIFDDQLGYYSDNGDGTYADTMIGECNNCMDPDLRKMLNDSSKQKESNNEQATG